MLWPRKVYISNVGSVNLKISNPMSMNTPDNSSASGDIARIVTEQYIHEMSPYSLTGVSSGACALPARAR